MAVRKRAKSARASKPRETMRYLAAFTKWPAKLTDGRIVAHNHLTALLQPGEKSHNPPWRIMGQGGFRAWTDVPDLGHYVECSCGWAPHLGKHYQVRGAR
jgi:hypothetical protein